MNHLLLFLALTAVCSAIVPLWWARTALQGTTLVSAWRWAMLAITAWITVAAMEIFAPDTIREPLSLAWYGVAIFSLCPAISVLGAQRPVVRVWTWFVVLPFCLVFSWPVAASFRNVMRGDQFVLETPMAVGFAFVVVMGVGNYLGTRYSLPALLTAASLWLLVLPLAAADFSWLPERELSRQLATFLIATAMWWSSRLAKLSVPARNKLDRVWIEFRDLYGIVWSKRILDRLNVMAEKDKLSVRMGILGVVSTSGTAAALDDNEVAALEKSLRWLLRRFVDETWIDVRLRSAHGLNDLA